MDITRKEQHTGFQWPGQVAMATTPGAVGFLLDLDAGTLEAFRDGVRMGLVVPAGLVGPMIWAADVMYDGECGNKT